MCNACERSREKDGSMQQSPYTLRLKRTHPFAMEVEMAGGRISVARVSERKVIAGKTSRKCGFFRFISLRPIRSHI